ncbi:hypothetical protein UY3_17873 [Chelonia mydas]|uniref:Uncharacterized protein n=1 Tax=Chelonia mydas TaxID=8469 RepID=M7BA05_CHEMY|nr:hypothetical protein UY3_17873 [Chelonia mydas]
MAELERLYDSSEKSWGKSLETPEDSALETSKIEVMYLEGYVIERIALLINAALLEPAKAIWQTLAASLPTCKQAVRKYFIRSKGSEFVFMHPVPNSLVVDAVNQKIKHQFPCSTPSDKDSKPLDLLGCKVYASSVLQFHIANYTAILATCDHKNDNKFMDFIDDILEEKKQQFTALVSEGQIISHTALQAVLDAANIAARSMATAVVMHRGSWLSSFSFPREVQSTLKIFPSMVTNSLPPR